MDDKDLKKTAELVLRDFELETDKETISEEELLQLLANQLAYMIEYRLEFLLSLMYRLDIDERKINAALSPEAKVPPNIGLAKLVLQRQKQRVFTKKFYKQEQGLDMDGLEL